MTTRPILKLAAAWEQEYPRRAQGGLVSLTGFRYQFHCVLRDAVQAWINSPEAIAPSTEVISDILTESCDRWIITQVKRTGTSGSLHKALEELWSIECVVIRQFPELLPGIEYEVRCAKWELTDIEKSIKGWTPGQSVVDSDSNLNRFKSRVRPTTDPRPLDELISLLVRECKALKAIEWVEKWTSRLIDSSADNVDTFGKDLFESLRELKSESTAKLPEGILSIPPNFSEPTNILPGQHLVGEQPRPFHLTEGYFAPRLWQLELACNSFLRWLGADPLGSDKQRRLPVFWIKGRSGSGKSVLLLQLLARLSQAGIAPILWLGNQRSLLPDAMKWAVAVARKNIQPIIAIDDPYSPGEQGDADNHWERTLSQLNAARETGQFLPIVIACGPCEQAQSFELEMMADVQVNSWAVDPDLDTKNLKSLEMWFEQRTGKAIPDVGSGDILLVQRFFEWRTGERLDQFAQRFRGRVESLSKTGILSKLVSELLAVNRLYAGLPESVMERLSDGDRDSLHHLEKDHHVVIDAESGRPGMWLAHPHLADALFQGWFGEQNHHQRVGALRDGIITCLKTGMSPTEQTAPLWAIARAWNDKDIGMRLDKENTPEILRTVYPYFQDGQGRLTFAHLPIWIRLSSIVPKLRLDPAPVRKAIEEISFDRIDETGFRLTCHILISHLNELGSHRDGVLKSIRAILDEAPEWYQWPFVAADLTTHTTDFEDGCRLLKWVSMHRDARAAPWLLSTTRLVPGCKSDANKVAAELATSAPADMAWASLLENLLKEDGRFTVPIYEWARRHFLHPTATFVLTGLLLSEHEPSVELARRWVAKNNDSPVANFLIEPLCGRAEAGEFELEAAKSWVSPDRIGSDRLIQWLLAKEPSSGTILLAVEWLERQPRAVGWSYVFQSLLDVVSSDEHKEPLIQIGLDWLEHNGDTKESNLVFRKLLAAVSSDEQKGVLVQHGFDWLEQHTEEREWTQVLQKLLGIVSSDEQKERLIQRGLRWLDQHSEMQEWSQLVQKLLDVVSSDEHKEQLIQRGLEWLEQRCEMKEWAHMLLRRMLDIDLNAEQKERLIQRGLHWLEQHGEKKEWMLVLRKLMDVDLNAEQKEGLIQRGLHWLEQHGERKEWNYVFQELLDAAASSDQKESLIQLGGDWLRKPNSIYGWSFVLERLLGVVSSDEQKEPLILQGLRWLEQHGEMQGWNYVFRKLLDVVSSAEQKEALIELGLHWLVHHDGSQGWSYVFQKLLDVVSTIEWKESLIQQGLDRLKQKQDDQQARFVLQGILSASITHQGRFKCEQSVWQAALRWLRRVTNSKKLEFRTIIDLLVSLQSRRRYEESRAFENGQTVHGTVLYVDTDTAYIDLDEEVIGRVSLENVSWNCRQTNMNSFFAPGLSITGVILKMDSETDFVPEIGIKQLTPDPWLAIRSKYPPGRQLIGTVTKITNFGLFVLIAPELEGLVHWSESGAGNSKELSKSFTTGQNVTVRVLSIDSKARSITLSICDQAGNRLP